jgi:AbiJ N-terminal domain 4
MAISDIFSKRRKRSLGGVTDVFVYDDLPQKLRIQAIHIINHALGEPQFDYHNSAGIIFTSVVSALRQEHGVFNLVPRPGNPQEELWNFLLGVQEADYVLDVIELIFRATERLATEEPYHGQPRGVNLRPGDVTAELNTRFRENGVGYQFQSGEIIRVDSQLIHSEAVLPALHLLRTKGFDGANSEFLDAHKHYRHGDFKDAIVNAAKAFESTLKAICTSRKWGFDANATAKPLINIVLTNGLIPNYHDSQLSAVRSLLESAVTIRNKTAGHGDGPIVVDVPYWYARYALNITASTIVFLVEAHTNKR